MDGKSVVSSRDLRKKMKSRRKKQIKRCKEKTANIMKNSDSDCYEYLIRIAEIIETVRDDAYEMEVLAGNVFNSIKGNEVTYAKIQLTSKLLEDLLPYSNHTDFSQFIINFIDNLRPVFTDRIASHVLQKIVIESFRRYSQIPPETMDEEILHNYFSTVVKVAKFAFNNLESFIWEAGSNHVIRTILNVLNGIGVEKHVSDSDFKVVTPPEFQSLLEQFTESITNMPQFHDLCNQTLTSCLLQTLLRTSKQHEHICKIVIKRIIVVQKNESHNFEEEKCEPFLRLIESALEVANEKTIKKLYNTFFHHNLKILSVSKAGNFAVQKLIRNCKDQNLFENILEELQQVGESILEAKTTGVLLELAQGCLRFKTKQGEFVKMMMKILRCQKVLNEDSDITPLCCSMVTSDKYDKETTKINLHGTLIIQAMLHFGKPIKIINSLLNMEEKYLLELACDTSGCHIMDAYTKSSSVGEKSRERLFKKLTGYYTQLAMSKYGSRSLDAIWNGITTKNKVLLMEELKPNESELSGTQFGKLFVRKTNLNNFRRNRDEWIKREKTLETTKKCFSDIIPSKKPKLEL